MTFTENLQNQALYTLTGTTHSVPLHLTIDLKLIFGATYTQDRICVTGIEG